MAGVNPVLAGLACRCPNCGKVIFLGVLAVNTCPRCKRSLVTGNKVKKSR